MKNLSAILALAILLTVGLACSDSGETTASNGNTTNTTSESKNSNATEKSDSAGKVTLQWVKLYTDDGSGDAGDEVTKFKATDNPQHFKAKLSEFEGGTKVKFVFTAVNADGEKNVKIMEREDETNSLTNQVVASLKLPRPFPVGDYKVDVYVNGKLDKTVNYKVE